MLPAIPAQPTMRPAAKHICNIPKNTSPILAWIDSGSGAPGASFAMLEEVVPSSSISYERPFCGKANHESKSITKRTKKGRDKLSSGSFVDSET